MVYVKPCSCCLKCVYSITVVSICNSLWWFAFKVRIKCNKKKLLLEVTFV